MNVSGNRRLLSAICGIFIVIIIFIWGYKKSVDITISAGLATDKKDNIYLAIDRKIYKFDSLGKLLLTVKGGFGPLLKVAVDDQENIYVADATNYQLKRFLANGTLALTVPLASEFRPGRGWDDAFGVTVDNDGNVWVCMATRHRLQKFSPSGQLLLQYPEDKTKLELCYPNEIAFDKDRNAYIANSRGYSIDVLDGNLAFLRSVPARELDGGLYHCPTSICVDSEGHIYVAALDDFYSKGKIYKLDPWGQVLATFSPEDEEGNQLLPSDIAVTDGRVFSIDQDRMLVSVFGVSGEKAFLDAESDLVRVLSRKRLLMKLFSNAPIALGILGGGLLVLLIILKLTAALTSSKLRTTESIQTAREEGFSFHRTVFGLPISIVMWVSLAAVLLSSSGQLKELFLVMSLSRGGFRTMHPGLLSSLSYNLEYTIPFIFAAVAVFLFWKLRYPKCLKFLAILLLIFTLAHFLRMVDPFGVQWLRLIDVPIFYLSSFSIFGVPLTTLATIIVFFIVNRGAIRYRRGAVRLNSDAIEALTGQKKITIPWQKVDRVLEVKWPYRTILVCGHSDSIAFDKFLKGYEEVISDLALHTGQIKILRDLPRRILVSCILVIFLAGLGFPVGVALYRDFVRIARERQDVQITRKPPPLNIRVNLPDIYQTDEESFTITGFLNCPDGATVAISVNDEVEKSQEYSASYASLSHKITLTEGENRIEVCAESPNGGKIATKGMIVYDPHLSYENQSPISITSTREFLTADLDGDTVTEVFLVDAQSFLTVLKWKHGNFQIVWQSIPLHHVEKVSTCQMQKGYSREHLCKAILLKLGYGHLQKNYLLQFDAGSYALRRVQQGVQMLREIPDTDGDGQIEFLRKHENGIEILEKDDGDFRPILGIPRIYSDVLIEDVNGNGIAEIYSFVFPYKAIFVQEWEAGAHGPIQPDAPLQQIVARLRGDLGYGYSLGFSAVPDRAVAGDFHGDGNRELLLVGFFADIVGSRSRFLIWHGGRYKCVDAGSWESAPEGNLLAGDVNDDARDEVVCSSGIFGLREGRFVLLESLERLKKAESIGERAKRVAVADFNGDGIAEVIASYIYDGKIILVEWQEGQFFQKDLPIEY